MPNPMLTMRITGMLLAFGALTLAGCFHEAVAKREPAPDKVSIKAPYDEAWDATLEVVKNNQLRIQAQDPVHGILEAQGRHFTLQDADCGIVGTPLGKVPAEPTDEATTVFNFYLAPDGPEATALSIQATFSTPGNAPFHPTSNLNCVSKGRQEALLFDQIKQAASQQRRPAFKKPEETLPEPDLLRQKPEQLLRQPDLLQKPDTQKPYLLR